MPPTHKHKGVRSSCQLFSSRPQVAAFRLDSKSEKQPSPPEVPSEPEAAQSTQSTQSTQSNTQATLQAPAKETLAAAPVLHLPLPAVAPTTAPASVPSAGSLTDMIRASAAQSIEALLVKLHEATALLNQTTSVQDVTALAGLIDATARAITAARTLIA